MSPSGRGVGGRKGRKGKEKRKGEGGKERGGGGGKGREEGEGRGDGSVNTQRRRIPSGAESLLVLAGKGLVDTTRHRIPSGAESLLVPNPSWCRIPPGVLRPYHLDTFAYFFLQNLFLAHFFFRSFLLPLISSSVYFFLRQFLSPATSPSAAVVLRQEE